MSRLALFLLVAASTCSSACGSASLSVSASIGPGSGDDGGTDSGGAFWGGPDGSSDVTVHGPDASTAAVSVTPPVAHLAPGGTLTFSATVKGVANGPVAWSVQEGASGGSVNAKGLYTAPASDGTYHVVATSSAAGATGSATVVVATPRSCTAIPAVGAWDSTSIAPVSAPPNEPSYQFNGKAVAIIVDPFDSSTVWFGTGNSGLFKSTDCGGTWTHVNTGKNGAAIDQSVLWSMVVDPVNQGVIYVVGAYGALGLWKSTNAGVDWVQLFPAGSQFAKLVPNNFVGNVSMDASNPKHLVVASHGVCNAPYPNGCMAETFDGGQTWPNIVGMPAAWGERGGVQVINATTWILGTGDNFQGLYITTDNGHTWTQALPPKGGDGNGELSMQPLQRANDGAYYVTSLQGVLRSTDGVAWSLAWGQQNGQTAAVTGIAVTPTTIYASEGVNFYSAPLSNYASWAPIPAPAAIADSASFLAYDGTHHLLYASCWAGGVFRLHTPD